VDKFLVYQPLGHSHYADQWSDFNAAQCRYDLFHDEWDLCPALDHTGTPDHVHNNWDNDADEDSQKFDFPLLPTKDSEIHPEGIHSLSTNLQWVHGMDQDDHNVPTKEAPTTLLSINLVF
jgi:hypothetical protein